MGLDSYLKKMPRYKDTTAHEVSVIESYLGWIKEKESGSKYANCTKNMPKKRQNVKKLNNA